MNRRDLLKAFAFAVPALALAPAVVLDSDVEDPLMDADWEWATSPAYYGSPQIVAFQVYGTATENFGAGFAQIHRVGQTDSPLIRMMVHSLGGMARWLPPPGHEILVPKQFPVEVYKNHKYLEATALVQLTGHHNYQVIEARM